jgi:heat shock protein HslJ
MTASRCLAIFALLFLCAAAIWAPAADSTTAAEKSITGIVWKWQQTRLGDGQTFVPGNPERYTIAFQPDGSLAIRADCNRVGGNYTSQNTSLTIETTFSTRAMCPPDSLDQVFLKHLNSAAIYFVREGALYIDLQADTGTMKFNR